MQKDSTFADDYGPQRLTLELANICNLHCSYCFRAEDNLYSNHAEFFSTDLLRRILREAGEVANINRVIFTGGEPTLHPKFAEVIQVVADAGLSTSFVTNGWHFERVWPTLNAHRKAISHVAFSLDGITREVHDKWRGAGSFDRLIRAFTRCYMSNFPFVIKMAIRRDMVDQLEESAIFAARMGAKGLNFVHVMPTSGVIEESSALSLEERRPVEQEIAILSRILKMNVGLDVGYYNINEDQAPCSPLAGTSMNIDYLGRLSLCCNLSGYRGANEELDVVADLKVDSFATGYKKLLVLAEDQLQKRKAALAELREQGVTPDLYTGSPCLFCLQSYGKIPWHKEVAPAAPLRSLPVHNSVA
jgi:MoaA/NifB/PqqE/SkfB family radical SAM enzyme